MSRISNIEFDLIQSIKDLIHELKAIEKKQEEIDQRVKIMEEKKE